MSVYSFLNFNASRSGANGPNINLGYGAAASEEGITTSMVNDRTTIKEGADGSQMTSVRAGRLGRMTVRLQKTSPVNNQLAVLAEQQWSNPAQANDNNITVNDVQRGDVATLTGGSIVKSPDYTWAVEGNMVEWVFQGYLVVIPGTGVANI